MTVGLGKFWGSFQGHTAQRNKTGEMYIFSTTDPLLPPHLFNMLMKTGKKTNTFIAHCRSRKDSKVHANHEPDHTRQTMNQTTPDKFPQTSKKSNPVPTKGFSLTFIQEPPSRKTFTPLLLMSLFWLLFSNKWFTCRVHARWGWAASLDGK